LSKDEISNSATTQPIRASFQDASEQPEWA
jgi:hypothetical protein